MNKFFLFLIIFLAALHLNAQDIRKSWYGTLDIQGAKLRLVFNISGDGETYSTTLDSPDQGAKGIPTNSTIVNGDSVTILAGSINMEFKGRIAPSGNVIEGTFMQNGFSFPLKLTDKEESAPAAQLRPQDPRDFPYYVEEFFIPNYEDSVGIAGTLTMPYSAEVDYTVILISGSGPQDRNEEIPSVNHRPFLVLSDYLTRQGMAVLRYDDRGIGGSTGIYGAATTEDFSRDAAAVVAYAKSRADLSDSKIGLIGHSEGGMIAPMLADKVDFLVLLAAPGTSTGQLLLSQSRLISETSGVQDSVINVNEKMMRNSYAYLLENTDKPDSILSSELKKIITEVASEFPEDVRTSLGDPEEFSNRQVAVLLSPWFRYFLNFVPYEHLSRVTIPVLALNGTLDLQVPYNENLRAIELALNEAGNENFELIALEGLNHLFQYSLTGAPAEYSKISETFNEDAMEAIVEWIKGL